MSAETHDPIDLLKASVSNNLPAVLLTAALDPAEATGVAAYISFPQPSGEPINLTKDTPTRYTSKVGSTAELYNVGQLWFALTEKNTSHAEYLKISATRGVGHVSITDRRDVVGYLEGTNNGSGRVLGKEQDAGERKERLAGATC